MKERRVDYSEVISQLSSVATEVSGINKRLDRINGSITDVNKICPKYREKVDNVENDMAKILPQVTGLRVKLYAGMAMISFLSAFLGAIVMKYLGG